jgi:phosphatidylglycerophosphate synthase
MFDIQLRQVKDQVLLPLLPLIPQHVSPNHITFLAFLVGLVACVAATLPSIAWVAVYLWFLNRLLDNLDGMLARSRKRTSQVGGFLDLLSDFIVYSVIPISIAYGQYKIHGVQWFNASSFLALAILEATFHVNNFVLFYCAAVSAQKDEGELTSLTMKPALIEGFESGVIFTAMLVWPQYIVAMSWCMSLGVVVGTVQRVFGLVNVLHKVESREVKKQ